MVKLHRHIYLRFFEGSSLFETLKSGFLKILLLLHIHYNIVMLRRYIICGLIIFGLVKIRNSGEFVLLFMLIHAFLKMDQVFLIFLIKIVEINFLIRFFDQDLNFIIMFEEIFVDALLINCRFYVVQIYLFVYVFLSFLRTFSFFRLLRMLSEVDLLFRDLLLLALEI